MTIRQILVITGVSTLLVLGLVRYCDRDRVTPTEPGKLAPTEKERIEVHGKTVTVIRADKTIKTYAPGGAKVHVNKDGSIDVEIKRFGLAHEGGAGAAWNGDKLKLAVDVKFAYYRRLGLHAGLAYDPTSHKFGDIVRPLAFVSYALPYDGLANTSLWIGTELFPQRLSGGIRLAF